MPSTFSQRLSPLCLCLLLAMHTAHAAAADFDDSPRDYDLPAAELAYTLEYIARQSGLELSYDPQLVAGRTATALRGRFSSQQAFRQSLAGSGLRLQMTANGALTLVTSRGDSDVELGSIGISAQQHDLRDVIYQNPNSISRLSREQIERLRGSQPADIFRGTPGVLSGEARNSGSIDLNIRGMQGMNRVPVTIDGSQQSTTVYRGYSGVASRNYIDPDMIGSITLEKGPSADVEGTGAIGGLVKMQTLSADDIIKDGKDFGLRLKGGFNDNSSSVPDKYTMGGAPSSRRYVVGCGGGATCVPNLPEQFGATPDMDRPSFGQATGGNGSLALAKRWERLELVGVYAKRKSGNYHAGEKGKGAPEVQFYRQQQADGRWTDYASMVTDLNRFRNGEEVLNTSTDNQSYLLKALLHLDHDQTLELGYMNFQSHFGEIMPSQIIRGDGAVQSRLSDVEANTYTLRYHWSPDSDLWDLKANYWQTDLDNLTYPALCLTVGTQTECADIHYASQAHRWGVDLSNTSRLDWLGKWQFNYGASYTKEDTQPVESEYRQVDGSYFDAYGTRDASRGESSLFAASQWEPTRWLRLDGALRYTRYKSADHRLDGSNPNLSKRKQDDGVTPIAALTLSPLDGLQFYVRYAEALRMPSLHEDTTGFSTPTYWDDLKPEHAKNWEYGINVLKKGLLSAEDRLGVKYAFFDNTVEDYLTRTTSSIGNSSAELIRNIDSAEFRGYEVSAEYSNDWGFAEAAFTYYQHTNYCYEARRSAARTPACYAGGLAASYARNHVPPKKSGNVTLGTHLFDQRLTLGTLVTHVGSRPDVAAAAGSIAVVQWRPYTLVNLFGNLQVTDNLRLDMSIDNLTDRYYMDALTLGLMASPGRTLHLGLTLEL